MTFQIPPAIDIPTHGIQSLNELYNAKSNIRASGSVSPHVQPGLFATANQEKFKLVAIIGDAVTLMYTQNGPLITALQVLQLYGRFVSWRDGLSSEIASVFNGDGQAPPHVLSLL